MSQSTDRLAVIADIQGDARSLTRVLDDLNRRDVGEVLCAGDIVGDSPTVDEAVRLVQNNVEHTVFGNHDARVRSDFRFDPAWTHEHEEHDTVTEALSDAQLAWLTSLLPRIETDEFVLAHSWPYRSRDADKSLHGFNQQDYGVSEGEFTDAGTVADGRVVCLGHTHHQGHLHLDKFKGLSGVILNPGSVGGDGAATYSVVDLETHEVAEYTVEE